MKNNEKSKAQTQKEIMRNRLIVFILGMILILVIGFIILHVSNSKHKKQSENNMVKLETNLSNYAKKFYDETYYAYYQDKAKLANFMETGISIDLVSLDLNVSFDEETNKILKKKHCSSENTKVIIYPKAPYGAKDYTVKVELSCEK